MTEKETQFGKFASQARESGAGVEIDYATLAFWEISSILSLRVGTPDRRRALKDLMILLTPYLDQGSLNALADMFRKYKRWQENQRGERETDKEYAERKDKDVPVLNDRDLSRRLDDEWLAILLQAMKTNDLLPRGVLRDIQGPHR